MKMRLIYITIIIFLINVNVNYALKKKAFLRDPTLETNSSNQTEKKSDQGENNKEKNRNESANQNESASAKIEEKSEESTEHSRTTETIIPEKTSPNKPEAVDASKSDEKNQGSANKLKPEATEKNRANTDIKVSEDASQKREIAKPLNNNENKNVISNENKNIINIENKNIINNENKNIINKNNKSINNENKNNIDNNNISSNDNKIESSRTRDTKNTENNTPVKQEAVIKVKPDEKRENVASRVQLPEKSDKVEAPLEKTTVLHPVSYHREASVIYPTPMISSASRITTNVVGPSCLTPATAISPAITSSVIAPGIVRETTIVSTPITPTLPIPMMQRNLRVTEVAPPAQTLQAFGTPVQNVYSASPFAPINRVMGFSTAVAPQPPVIQKTVTQNTMNGIPVGPPLVNTVITPPPPQIANRVISQIPVANSVMSSSPVMINRIPTPVINGLIPPSPVTMINRINTTPVVNGIVSPPVSLVNRMSNPIPGYNGYANRFNSNDVYVFG